MKAAGCLGGVIVSAAKALAGFAVLALKTVLKAACALGLYVPAAYLAYGAVLHLAFGFGLFERSVDGALYIFGFALCFGCSAVITVRRLRTKPLKDLLRVAAEEYAGKRRSKNAPEVPRMYRSRVNRGVTVYEYADRYDLYEKRGKGLALVKTEWKKDKR